MVVPLATCVVFPLAEVAVPRALFATILRRIDRLRGPPLPAAWREGYGAMADAQGESYAPKVDERTGGPEPAYGMGGRWPSPPQNPPRLGAHNAPALAPRTGRAQTRPRMGRI